MAICKGLCELMGGQIWAVSSGQPEQGSTFYFTIQTQAHKRLLAEVDEALKSFDHVKQLSTALRRGDGAALEEAADAAKKGRRPRRRS